MILLQASYLQPYSLLTGISFEVLSLGSYALVPTLLPLLQTFMELLLWNTFQCRHHIFFWCLQYPEIFVPLMEIYFWKQPQVIWSKIRGIGQVFHFHYRFLGQKLLHRQRFVRCSIVMVENPTVGSKFRPFSTHSFM
jgi:hypothetical protein